MTWAPDYLTAQQLSRYLDIQDGSADAWLGVWVTTVSRNVDDFCGRQFGQVAAAEDRYYQVVYDLHECRSYVDIDDVQDVTGLTVSVDGTAVDAADVTLLPRNAAAVGRPYTQIRLPGRWRTPGEATVHAKFGWSSVPSTVLTGMYLQGARLAARRDSPFGISGSPQEQGEIRLLAQLDPDFRTALKPYVRTWWAR